jgi:5'-3' exonuclease
MPIDVLALDLNGLFHPVAQKVYQYGSHAPPQQFLSRPRIRPRSTLHLFKEICEKIEYCRRVCNPRKKLLLCVDGVAGLGKMNQQRQRRFRTSKLMEGTQQTFNPNAFTPGTRLMDHLTKYIDWYIRSMISYHPEWKGLEVIFSNEKVPGEGEHKIMQYIREHGSNTDSYCIYGLDADLMMLGMVLPVDKIIIAREAEEGIIQYVNVSLFRTEILNLLRWPSGSIGNPSAPFHEREAIYDFIILCFLVGNDFLPTIPSMTIIDGGIDIMMDIYKGLGQKNGHLTRMVRGSQKIALKISAVHDFFKSLGDKEIEMIEKKYTGRIRFFPDPLILKNLSEEGRLDMTTFKDDYYTKNFTDPDLKKIVHTYLDGICWVLNYYLYGIPDWLWYYPYQYAPFLSDFLPFLGSYKNPQFDKNQPVPPFLQLMMVLPSSSSDLVPDQLSVLMNDHDSPLRSYYPKDFGVDMAGKKHDWEGIVLLPNITLNDFLESYRQTVRLVPPSLLKRNIRGTNFIYRFQDSEYVFLSFYGNIDKCHVKTTPVTF